MFLQTRNDFLQLLLDTANESSEDSKIDSDIKDDIDENYGKDGNDQIFKQTIHKKKSKFADLNELLNFIEKYWLFAFEILNTFFKL